MSARAMLGAVVMTVWACAAATAQTATIRGTVTDSDLRPLTGVNMALADEGTGFRRATTNQQGVYVFRDVAPGAYTLTASLIGYSPFEDTPVRVGPGDDRTIDIALEIAAVFGDTLVVSVSRQIEKAVEAPASVSLVDQQEIAGRQVLTVPEHLRHVPAVDVASSGLNQTRIAIRGFNNALSTFDKTLVLVDNRNTHIPGLRHNIAELLTPINDDIERIEVVRGPGSALYGANAANGVMHIITKSPFDSPGTTATIGIGERDLFSASFRHASVFSQKFALKVSGSLYTGADWEYDDPAEPDSVLLGQYTLEGRVSDDDPIENLRDFDVENYKAEARLDFRPGAGWDVNLTGGVAQMKGLMITDVGASQNADWRNSFGQLRASKGRFFGQVFLNAGNTENPRTYLRRTGDRIVDKSRLFVAQLQHGTSLADGRQDFIYGADAYLTRPNTNFTIHGRFEDDDSIDLFGAYVQSETELTETLRLVATARVDAHSRLDAAIFSPRAALVFNPDPDHTFRATYNRAFTTPSSPQLFLDLNLGQLGPLPYGLRGLRSPDTGYSFMRDSETGVGGFFMQSPFNAGGREEFIDADVTQLWSSVVAILGGQGVDISGIPAPGTAEVATVLAILNTGTGAFDAIDPGDLNDIGPPEPGITNTFEVGYRGLLSDRWLFSADVYYSQVENFVSSLDVQTPNAFYDAASLTTYLTGFMPADEAAGLAAGIAAIPLGTITPSEAGALSPADLILTFRNFKGDVSLWGTDLNLQYSPTPRWGIGVNYSHISKDLFPRGPNQIQDIALNAPMNKVNGIVTFRDPAIGLDTGVRIRYVDSFPVLSGVFAGTVDSYTVVDVNAAYPLPFHRRATLRLSVQNLFDNEHFEYIGTPAIGRLAMLQLAYSF
ncbi:MAG: TonB-dependent receptor [Gemmatimonadota bacterium]|nr:TonB-dependent receptor [Gemmatimonadota bacterium]